MYEFTTRSKRAEKQFYEVIESRSGIREKLLLLKNDPRRELDAHPLKGRLEGKWSCWLGSNIRLIYEIDNNKKEIIVVSAGSHKEY